MDLAEGILFALAGRDVAIDLVPMSEVERDRAVDLFQVQGRKVGASGLSSRLGQPQILHLPLALAESD